MNRNVDSRFALTPNVEIQRSIFRRNSRHLTSFNVGQVIPFYIDEVLPGDTFKIKTSKVIRLQTMLTPMMDNLFADIMYFYIPNRLLWNHWEEFMGENKSSAWVQQTQYAVPRISAPVSTGFTTGSLADYLGLPTGIAWSSQDANAPSALPFRAYAKICEDWFRSEVLTDPLNIPTGDSDQTGTNGSSYINDVANGGAPFIACKTFDVFTSALPSPQKGNSVTFPLLSGSLAPVLPYTQEIYSNGQDIYDASAQGNHRTSLKFGEMLQAKYAPITGNHEAEISSGWFKAYSSTTSAGNMDLIPNNLYADLSQNVGAVSINELRLAFQLQKFYERCARGGTRYIELLKSHFGVTSPDARLQRSEYLGGNRVPLNIHEVTNSAQTQSDFLGDVGAKCATSDVHYDVQKSFVEHGFIIGVVVVRYKHTYAQGMEKFWLRKNMLDYYFPVFSQVGEMPIESCEVCATAANMQSKSTFAYQEAWYDYRYKPDRCSAEMRPGIQNSLASWHLADYYQQAPTFSDAWIREDKTNVDRVLAVTSQNAHQIFADFLVENIATRCMPMYSVPGLIDHH